MKKILTTLIATTALHSHLFGFDYSVSGSAQSYSKFGFNTQALDLSSGAAPTDSFTTLYSNLTLNANLGAGFSFALGGAIGGIAYDSTDAIGDSTKGVKPNISPVVASYFGVSWDKRDVQNYIIQDAALSYRNDYFYIKAGRYLSREMAEWFGGHTQGAETYVKFGAFRLWGFLSNRRSVSNDKWFKDFYRVFGTYDNGATRNTYAIGLDIKPSDYVNLSLFTYYVLGAMSAPGASLTIDSYPNFDMQGFRSTTKIKILAPTALSTRVGTQSGRNWGEINKQSYTIYIDQRFDIDRFLVGLGVYKNIGNANELIGRWGNPLWFDIWSAGAYDIGQSLSDIVGKDATTGYGYFGANHNNFDWKILARFTNSPRSMEQNVALLLDYKIRKDISIGGKIEWFSDTTKAGYSPIFGYYPTLPTDGSSFTLAQDRTDDRSNVIFYIRHRF